MPAQFAERLKRYLEKRREMAGFEPTRKHARSVFSDMRQIPTDLSQRKRVTYSKRND